MMSKDVISMIHEVEEPQDIKWLEFFEALDDVICFEDDYQDDEEEVNL